MAAELSALRQKLWRQYGALGRLLRTLSAQQALTPGSFYLLRRKCGKPTCRCARGQLHAVWVLTRSEAGQHKLYTVPREQRAEVRLREGNYEEAVQLNRLLYLKDPQAKTAAQALLKIGDIYYLHLRRIKDAVDAYKKLVFIILAEGVQALQV